jgi:hypothetical protein
LVTSLAGDRAFDAGGRHYDGGDRSTFGEYLKFQGYRDTGASRIANNLNQLAHHANTGTLLLDETTLTKIEEPYAHVVAMRNALMRALGLMEETNA